MNHQQICPEDRKVIWCDKDRCRWRTGLCPPFRGSVCPFGGGTIACRTGSVSTDVDAKAIAERLYSIKKKSRDREYQRKQREAGKWEREHGKEEKP